MERSQQHPWIQLIGRVAIHQPGRESHELVGASRILLSILAAAGPEGLSVGEVADCYWNQSRPASWKVALRVSASHLDARLPDGWDVRATDNRLALAPGEGFVDVWRIDQLQSATDQDMTDIAWVGDGDLFSGVTGIDIVEAAASRLTPRLQSIRASAAGVRAVGADVPKSPEDLLLDRIRGSRRTILLARPNNHDSVARCVFSDVSTENHIVVGDRRMLLPLGPFAMTFPDLRAQIDLGKGTVEQGSAARAFRVVADSLAAHALHRPQRLAIANAHELDTKSLKLASMLIDQGRLSDFSLLMYADDNYRDIRWLDFVRRSVTAGCELITFDPVKGPQ